MSIAKRAAEVLRTLETIDRRDVSRAFAFESRQAYDLATAAIDRTGSAQRAADLIDSGWSHTDMTMHVSIGRVTIANLMEQSLPNAVKALEAAIDQSIIDHLCSAASVNRLASKIAAPTSQASEAGRDAGLVPPGVDDLDQLADAEVDVGAGRDGEPVPGVDQRGG